MTHATVQHPIDRSRDGVAQRLAESHYRVDPAIRQVIRLLAPMDEDSSSEPIKLLEVNEETSMSGVVPVFFGAHAASGIFFPSVIVEVRPEEFEQMRLGIGETLMPLGALRKRLHQLPQDKEKEIVCYCKISLRGYEAALVLEGNGWKNVKVMEGGVMAWPFPREK